MLAKHEPVVKMGGINKMKKAAIAALAFAGAYASGMGITYFTYRKVFYSSPKRDENYYKLPGGEQYKKQSKLMHNLIAEMDRLPHEQVYIKAFDGIRLAGRYYHMSDNAPLMIQFHGYRGYALRDSCGGNKIAREMGHNILVIDQRAHGKSEGTTISFGINERRDCVSWIEYARKRFGENNPIILSGVSMGAATVLMASELKLPENVVCIIADSPYSSPEAIIRKVCGDMYLSDKFMYPFINLGAGVFGKFNLAEANPVEAVKHATVPVMIIHGEDDRFVPCDMSKEIYDSSPELIVRETFPEAGHGISYVADTARYKEVTGKFIHKCLEDFYSRHGVRELIS